MGIDDCVDDCVDVNQVSPGESTVMVAISVWHRIELLNEKHKFLATYNLLSVYKRKQKQKFRWKN